MSTPGNRVKVRLQPLYLSNNVLFEKVVFSQ